MTKPTSQTQKKKTARPLLVAHRGGNLSGPNSQNTLAAFQLAAELAYKYIETDVIISRDKQIIIYHGSSSYWAQRKTGQLRRSKLQKLTYKQIQRLLPRGQAPKLVEAFKYAPESTFVIDAKTDEVVDPLIKLIRAQKVHTRVSLTSFSMRRSKKLKQALPDVKVGICIHPWQARLRHALLFELLKRANLQFVHYPWQFITPTLVKQAHAFGISVWAYTPNQKKEFRALSEADVDAIISDEIGKLQEFFSGH